jgi:PIN domain nuclease of toxin-antitoxin system
MEATMIHFLDTNAVIWLYQGEIEKFSESIKSRLEDHDLFISPLVKLELQHLYEIERIREKADKVTAQLYDQIGLQIHNIPLNVLIEHSLSESWTRDPFDRLITCHARIENGYLITRDQHIRANYNKALW